jgi:hypothetical protein
MSSGKNGKQLQIPNECLLEFRLEQLVKLPVGDSLPEIAMAWEVSAS